jgi:hypothetical protein
MLCRTILNSTESTARRAELQRMVSYAAVYKRIEERKADRLKEMNIAPAFFGVAADALYSGIIIGVDKLLDENGDRGFFNLLSFVGNNRDCFSIESLHNGNAIVTGTGCLIGTKLPLRASNGTANAFALLQVLRAYNYAAISFMRTSTRSTFSILHVSKKRPRSSSPAWTRSSRCYAKS